jgi:flagellar biosynthesis protein FlhA
VVQALPLTFPAMSTAEKLEATDPQPFEAGKEVGFAFGLIAILTVFFVPLPPLLLDIGLAASFSLSLLILMVALWIKKPLEFSAFPVVLLLATILRLALNIATTRLILSHGAEGHDSAGYVIAGFAQIVMGGDFLIGIVVFLILITVNFIVITKGASRIAEVGARFTLDAIPGKQMAIDADLAAGAIDEPEASRRRRELEEESSFFGAMDGASKFVRGDAIASLIITAINIFGGIIIGVTRHEMSFGDAADVFVKLSVGDGLVTQIPALIVSLAAGLLISKGGTRGSADKAVVGQLLHYPRAVGMAAVAASGLALAPGLPFAPFFLLSAGLGVAAATLQRASKSDREQQGAEALEPSRETLEAAQQNRLRETLRPAEIEVVVGKQLSVSFLMDQDALAQRVGKIRRRFAEQYGFIIPEVKIADDHTIAPTSYLIKLSGTAIASGELRIGDCLVICQPEDLGDIPCDVTTEPAFNMAAVWVPELFSDAVTHQGFSPIDPPTVLLTHLGEIIKANLAQLLTYRSARHIFDGLDHEYRRLLEETVPSHLSFSSLQGVLKLLLAERVSIRNITLILEAIAEAAPHVRKIEYLAEFVRSRLAHQLTGDLLHQNSVRFLRLGLKWEGAFHSALRRDAKGEIIEFDFDPKLIEQFGHELSQAVTPLLSKPAPFALLVTADIRPFVRMLIERLYPALPVLAQTEVAKGLKIETIGAVSS